jgi:hypothetical protein
MMLNEEGRHGFIATDDGTTCQITGRLIRFINE